MKSKSRIEYTAKNTIWSIFGNMSSSFLNFVQRSIFLYALNSTYLGLNGLLTNILGILSFAELGIGSAINYHLYKPLAINDIPKIKSLMEFYKKAYKIVGLLVCIIGILAIPFLKYLIKDASEIEYIYIIYLAYLFNTVSSYFMTYRTTLLFADQKGYIWTNYNTVINIITVLIQCLGLIIFKNYFIFLFITVIFTLIKNLIIYIEIGKMYPYLKEKDSIKLNKEETNQIFIKVKSMLYHKIGDVCVNQTDNIIMSAIINVTTVGLVSNFTMITNVVYSFIVNFFGGATHSIGNLMATESKEKSYNIFKNFDFLNFWVCGFSSISLYFLLIPFVKIWLGDEYIIDQVTVGLLAINFYIMGLRISFGNIRTASGFYEHDKWVPFVQAILNLVISINLTKKIGLPGIYIGTLISSLFVTFTRPIIFYKHLFNTKCLAYFIEYLKRIIVLIISTIIISLVFDYISYKSQYLDFIVLTLECIIIPNLCIYIFYRKTKEFEYVLNILERFKNKYIKKQLQYKNEIDIENI